MHKYLLISLTALACCSLQAVNRVAVKARASEDYIKARTLDKTKKVQTYMVMKGRFYGGITADPTLEKVSFEDIVYDLAPHLMNQGFYPLSEIGNSDLLLVIHYGLTDSPTDLPELLGYTSMEDYGYNSTVANAGANGSMTQAEMNATADFGFQLAAGDSLAYGRRIQGYKKALMLGMEEAYENPDAPIIFSDQRLLQHLLREERYYIVVIAYDWPKLKAGQIEAHWVTRYSIRSIGQSFGDAVTAMNTVAGDYFGKNFKDLVQRRVSDKSRVIIGELEVIEQEIEERADER